MRLEIKIRLPSTVFRKTEVGGRPKTAAFIRRTVFTLLSFLISLNVYPLEPLDWISGYLRPELVVSSVPSSLFNPQNILDLREVENLNFFYLKIEPKFESQSQSDFLPPSLSNSPIEAFAEMGLIFRPLSPRNEFTYSMFQLYAGFNAGNIIYIRLGKQLVPLGTGFVFNPINKINQMKDPVDPFLQLEGRPALKVEWIPNEDFSISAFLLPKIPEVMTNTENLSEDIWGLVLYGLLWGTDIHVAAFYRSAGFAFVRDIEGIVVHGEFVMNWKQDLFFFGPTPIVGGAVNPANKMSYDQDRIFFQTVIGFHTQLIKDTFIVLEYYYNGLGYASTQLGDFMSSLNLLQNSPGVPGAASASLDMINTVSGDMINVHQIYLNISYTWEEFLALGFYAVFVLDSPGLSAGPYFEFIHWQNFNLRLLLLGAWALNGNPLNPFAQTPLPYTASLRLTAYF